MFEELKDLLVAFISALSSESNDVIFDKLISSRNATTVLSCLLACLLEACLVLPFLLGRTCQ